MGNGAVVVREVVFFNLHYVNHFSTLFFSGQRWWGQSDRMPLDFVASFYEFDTNPPTLKAENAAAAFTTKLRFSAWFWSTRRPTTSTNSTQVTALGTNWPRVLLVHSWGFETCKIASKMPGFFVELPGHLILFCSKMFWWFLGWP